MNRKKPRWYNEIPGISPNNKKIEMSEKEKEKEKKEVKDFEVAVRNGKIREWTK